MPLKRTSRLPRFWSNQELKKFSYLFEGQIINVSGYKDDDKFGNKYKNYFPNAKSYFISNWETKFRGFQSNENEILLDLTSDLKAEYINKFDVVFNHTTLEHIYNFQRAFQNLCLLSKDIVIIVVPFIQFMHAADYGDYWRFSPEAIKNLFEENRFQILYLSFNSHKKTSVYIFAIGSKNSEKWENKIQYKFDGSTNKKVIGINAIPSYLYYSKIRIKIERLIRNFLKKIRIY